jgi:zona occludens toxin (predicted ATPase)
MANNLNHKPAAPAASPRNEAPADWQTGEPRNEETAREFWDSMQSTLAQPTPRAFWILIGALCICAALITSAAAFATVYFL